MNIRKTNGDRYFQTKPETQEELELIMSKLDLVSATGVSARLHRAELERANLMIERSQEEHVSPPEGSIFVIRSRTGRFEISRWVMLGTDSYWGDARNVRPVEDNRYFEYAFLADSIAVESSFNWEDAGSVYAYYSGNDKPEQRARCRLDPGKYKIELCPAGEIPNLVINPPLVDAVAST